MHSGRRKSREIALQVLFLWDANGEKDADLALRVAQNAAADTTVTQRSIELADGAWDQRAVSDTRVEKLAPQWPPRRQPGVDRAIIRLAVWEMTHSDTPPKVIIDEAIELAKEFSTEQSPAFVNGVLDAVLREHRDLIREKPASAETPAAADSQAADSPTADSSAADSATADSSAADSATADSPTGPASPSQMPSTGPASHPAPLPETLLESGTAPPAHHEFPKP
jgi:N utilization substance protein B